MTRRRLFQMLPAAGAARARSRRDGLRFEPTGPPVADCMVGGCDDSRLTGRYWVPVLDRPGVIHSKVACERCFDWLLDQGVVVRDRTVYVIKKKGIDWHRKLVESEAGKVFNDPFET